MEYSSISIKAALHVYSKIIMSASQFVAMLVVAHFMGPTPLGMIGYATGVIGIFSLVANLGFSTTHRKKIAEGKDLGECIGTYFTIRMVLMTIWVSVFLVWIFNVQYMGNLSFSKEQEYVLYIVALHKILMGHSGIMRHTFWSNLEAAKSVLPKLSSRVLVSFLKILVAVSGMGVVMLAFTQVIGAFLLIIVYIYLFRNYPFKFPSRNFVKDYVKFTIPLMLTIPFTVLASSSSSVIIGSFWSVEEVAFFTVPLTLTKAIALTSGTIGLILLPLISKKSESKDWKSVHILVHESERFIHLYMLPITMLVIIFSKEIVSLLLGSSFSSSANVLRILVFYSFIDLTTRPYSTQLISTGHVNLTLLAGITCAIIHLILNIMLIPEEFLGFQLYGLGSLGAAIAILVGGLFRYFIYRLFAYLTIGTFFSLKLFKYYISSLFMFIFVDFTSDFLSMNGLLFDFLLGFTSIFLYIFSLYLLKGIDKRDINLIKKILDPSSFRNYVSKELKNNGQ